MNKIRILSLFSGIGAFEKALTNLGINYELVNFCEIDRYAVKSYCAIHGADEKLNLGDITKIDERTLKDFDMLTYGFPCTDISVAGHQKGLIDENGNKTRSGLLYDALRIIQCKQPKYAIAENVKNLVGKKFKKDFESYLAELEFYGYNSYWSILNAKDFNIPQNRERVFIISIRKDVDDRSFKFPVGGDTGIRLKHILEKEVNEKYYLKDEVVARFIEKYGEKLRSKQSVVTGVYNQKDGFTERDLACTLDASYYKGLGNNQNRTAVMEIELPCVVASRGRYNNNGTEQNYELNPTGCSNTITTVQKDNYVVEDSQQAIIIDHGQMKIRADEISSCLDANYWKGLDNHGARTGILQIGMLDIKDNERQRRVYDPNGISPVVLARGDSAKILNVGMIDIKASQQIRRIYNPDGLCPTLDTMGGGQRQPKILQQYRIRKLTPKECFLLMGFSSEDFEKASAVCSNSQIYKQAGNSIVVNVLEAIFSNLFSDYTKEKI